MTTDVFHLSWAYPGPFPISWVITGFVTRVTQRVSLLDKELLPSSEHLSSPPVFIGVRVTRSLMLSLVVCMSCRSLCVLLYFLAIVVSILLWFSYSDYPFEIFKVFLFQKRVVRTTFDIYVSITCTQYTINRNLDAHSKYITENK